MTERPILFSAPMVRAILAGTKTQTRRVVKPAHKAWIEMPVTHQLGEWDKRPLPYGKPGDRLWVRETWQAVSGNDRARPDGTLLVGRIAAERALAGPAPAEPQRQAAANGLRWSRVA